MALSPDAIQYYAHSVIRSEIFQLTRRDERNRYLHLVAFVAHQYYRLQDNLVAVLLTSVQRLQNTATRQHKEQCYTRREQHHESLKALVGYLDSGAVEMLAAIKTLTQDGTLTDEEKVRRIRSVLDSRMIPEPMDAKALGELKTNVNGLLKNDVVKSDIHSTDAFGYSEAIFTASFLVDVAYAPRFKNLKRQRRYLFRSRKNVGQSEWRIKPDAYRDTDLIIAQWDDILHFIATIKLKEITVSDIFRRLNSYSKQHGLYQALKAFGQIPKSLFILRYIDEPELRMSIEKVLNGIEHVHRFTRAVSVGSPREFLNAEKEDQKLAEACKRLINNCIVCWNYLYLSQQFAAIDDPAKREEFVQALRHGSAASWRHVNLLGEYDFSDARLKDSVGIKPPKLID